MFHYVMVETDSQLKLLPASKLDIKKCLSTFICCPWAYSSSLQQLFPHYFTHILGFWVTCGVKMMSLRHRWDWQPTQTSSFVTIRHIKSVWAHSYAVHGHTALASNSYTHTTWVIFWGSGSFVQLKWCHYFMVETDSKLKLLTVYILGT
jgi:hypothetical protein